MKRIVCAIICFFMVATMFAGIPTINAYGVEGTNTNPSLTEQEEQEKQFDIGDAKITLSSSQFEYTGTARRPSVKVVYDGKTLTKGDDYSIEYKNNIKAGQATVIVKGSNEYTGQKTAKFTIYYSLKKAKIKLSGTEFSYNRETRKPWPIITYGDNKLKKNVDYRVKSYKNNKYPGTASIVIEGIGKYKGTVTKKFYIARVNNFKVVSRSTKSIKLGWSKRSNVTGYKLYKYSFTTKKWKRIATIKGASKTSYTVKNLIPGRGNKYRIRTYVTKNGKTYYGPWNDTLPAATRPSKVSIKSFTSNIKLNATVKWKKRNATGYQVYLSKSPSFKYKRSYKVKSNDTLKKVMTGLENNETYYVKVRAYKTYCGTTSYGAWSDKKKVETDGTGWATLSGKKYYYKNGKPLKGTYTISGNKYFFNKTTGVLQGASATMWDKIKGQSSKTKWLVAVSRDLNRTCVYQRINGEWTLKHYWKCTTGAAGTRTPKGYFTVPSKKTNLNFFGIGTGYTCWHATRITGSVYFHSVLYYENSKTNIMDGRLGANLSHGCIRLAKSNALWIFKNIKAGTKVVIY